MQVRSTTWYYLRLTSMCAGLKEEHSGVAYGVEILEACRSGSSFWRERTRVHRNKYPRLTAPLERTYAYPRGSPGPRRGTSKSARLLSRSAGCVCETRHDLIWWPY